MHLTKYPTLFLAASITLIHDAAAVDDDRYLETISFSPCANHPNATQLSTQNFNFSLSPTNRTLSLSLSGSTTHTGNSSISLLLTSGPLQLYHLPLDPCQVPFSPSLCPTISGSEISLQTTRELELHEIFQIPDSVFSASGVEARVYAFFNSSLTGLPWGCVQGELRNGVEARGGEEEEEEGSSDTTTAGAGDGGGSEETGFDDEGGDGDDMSATTEGEEGGASVLMGSKGIGLVTAFSLFAGFLLL